MKYVSRNMYEAHALFYFGVVWYRSVFTISIRVSVLVLPSQWCHNEPDGVSNHQPPDCLRNRLFTRRSKKTSKLCVTGLCKGNSPVTGEFLLQRASSTENVSIWWRHHGDNHTIAAVPVKWPWKIWVNVPHEYQRTCNVTKQQNTKSIRLFFDNIYMLLFHPLLRPTCSKYRPGAVMYVQVWADVIRNVRRNLVILSSEHRKGIVWYFYVISTWRPLY